jgi:hypothetical protein
LKAGRAKDIDRRKSLDGISAYYRGGKVVPTSDTVSSGGAKKTRSVSWCASSSTTSETGNECGGRSDSADGNSAIHSTADAIDNAIDDVEATEVTIGGIDASNMSPSRRAHRPAATTATASAASTAAASDGAAALQMLEDILCDIPGNHATVEYLRSLCPHVHPCNQKLSSFSIKRQFALVFEDFKSSCNHCELF